MLVLRCACESSKNVSDIFAGIVCSGIMYTLVQFDEYLMCFECVPE